MHINDTILDANYMTRNRYIIMDENYRTTNGLQLRDKKVYMMSVSTDTEDTDNRLGCEIDSGL